MPVTYHDFCGGDMQLNQIIFAGAHDAGITGGRHNVKTQHVGIRLQANVGVRLFDVRVTDTPVGLATYHGAAKFDPKDKKVRGAYGEKLEKVLTEARDFVENEGSSEFLILKFDKCKGYRWIADACRSVLDKAHFKGKGSLNTKTLDELKGGVITVFSKEGLAEIAGTLNSADGIFGFRSLKAGDTHKSDYDGLQYFGKGGTNPFLAYSQNMKIRENRKTQQSLMRKGMSTTDPEVMGMMYWTSTGLFESIKQRDEKMWKKAAGKSTSVQSTWKKMLVESIDERIGNANGQAYSAGGLLKTFMPNIVMIDFADEKRCKIIREFNNVATTELVAAFQDAGNAV